MKAEQIDAIIEPMKATHASGMNQTYEWRMKQLKSAQKMLRNHQDEWADAANQDLGKEYSEASFMEVSMVLSDLNYLIKNLKRLMKPKYVPGSSLYAFGRSRILKKPLRSPGVLVIGSFNYPVQLAVQPAFGSLAAGNPTVIKPSPMCPATSNLLHKLVEQYFDPGALQVVLGGIPETTALLQREWGKICFTGSAKVGKIIAEAAAKTLTPTLLELGGKCPVYVDETAPNLTSVAHRITWGKTINAGQTCVAPDYVLCHEKHIDKLCDEMVKSLKIQFGNDPNVSEIGRIVSVRTAEKHVNKLKEEETRKNGPRIICGGASKCNPSKRYIEPTIVLNPSLNSKLMQEEIFSPIMPIFTVSSVEEAKAFINAMPGTPLGLYVFTKSERVFRSVIDGCPAAGSARNDVMIQAGSVYLPFGGLGSSGYGSYHGEYSFDAFTHLHSTMHRFCGPGLDFHLLRYHPYKGAKGKFLVKFVTDAPVLPVLHIPLLLQLTTIALLAYFMVPLNLLQITGNTLASALEFVAQWLRTLSEN